MKKLILVALALVVLVPAAGVGYLAIKYRPRASREDPAEVAREIANRRVLHRLPEGELLAILTRRLEAERHVRLLQSEDRIEAFRAWIEKRPGKFTGR